MGQTSSTSSEANSSSTPISITSSTPISITSSTPSETTITTKANSISSSTVEEKTELKETVANKCKPVAMAAFSASPPSWYTILTQSFPTAVPMSLNRNRGFAEGPVSLTDSGVVVQESGNYWVNITAYLSNPSETTSNIFPVFLARNDVFDFNVEDLIGVTIVLKPSEPDQTYFVSASTSGPLRNVAAGTKLSLVITNGGAPDPQPVVVVAWEISLHKL